MSETTCSCTEHPWRFYKAGERATYECGEMGCKFWVDLWERVFDELGLKVEQKRTDGGDFFCDRCGTRCTSGGKVDFKLSELESLALGQNKYLREQLDSYRPDAVLFAKLRALVAFGNGCFLLKDGDRIVVGEPVETICYAKIGEGCDEREAVRVAYENMMRVPPRDREKVTL